MAAEELKKCAACGHTQPDGDYCEECGLALPEKKTNGQRICPGCGSEQQGGEFCRDCGTRMPSSKSRLPVRRIAIGVAAFVVVALAIGLPLALTHGSGQLEGSDAVTIQDPVPADFKTIADDQISQVGGDLLDLNDLVWGVPENQHYDADAVAEGGRLAQDILRQSEAAQANLASLSGLEWQAGKAMVTFLAYAADISQLMCKWLQYEQGPNPYLQGRMWWDSEVNEAQQYLTEYQHLMGE
jgi:hypothetical protein